MPADADITGLVLAGGLGRRMGGRDKGLVELDGKPLAAHVIARLAPQVGRLLVNANRNPDAYAALGHPLVADRIDGFAGPLAGIEAGLSACTTPLLVCAPCDTPFLPPDLVPRLRAALETAPGTLIAFAQAGGRSHPVFCLVRVEVLSILRDFVEGGGRRVEAWMRSLPHAVANFDDQAGSFANINEPGQLSGTVEG